MATKLVFDRRGLHLDCTTSTKPRPKPRTAWPVPEFPTTSSWLTLSLEQATQSSRVGIRVASVGTLPGGATAVWTIQHHAYQGAAPVEPDWDETPVSASFSILVADALPKAAHVFRLKREEAGQTHLYATATITTPDDTVLVLTLEGILADDKIITTEKAAFNSYTTAITTEQTGLDAEADTWKCSRTAYDNAITALLAAIAALDPPTSDMAHDTVLASGGGATLLALFRAIYSARDALKEAIQAAKTGGIGDPFSDDILTPQDKRQIKTYWNEIINDQTGANGLDAQADAAGCSRTSYDGTITTLEAYLDALTGTGGWEPTGNDWRDYTSTYALPGGGGAALRALFVAVWAAATALRNAISNAVAADDILTISQKRDAKAERDRLQSEKAGLDAQADLAGVSRVAYDAALSALESHLDGLTMAHGWDPGTHDWDDYTDAVNLGTGGGQTLRAAFKSAKTERDALQGAINEVLSGADWVTPGEKPHLKARWDAILAEQVTLDADADSAGVSRSDYDTAITNLDDFFDGIAGIFTIPGVAVYLESGGRTTMEGLFKIIADEKAQLESAINQARISALPQDTFRPGRNYDFGANDAGFTITGGSAASSADGTYRTITASGACDITSPALNASPYSTYPTGKEAYVVIARVRLVSGTWDGRLQFTGSSPSVPFEVGHQKDVAGPVEGEWRELAWDLRSLDAGGLDYVNNTAITSIKILLTTGAGVVDVDWVALGTYGAGSKSDYDLSVANAATLYMDKATFLDGGKIKGTEIKDESIKTPSLAANIIFSKNLIVANFDNLVPNPSSEGDIANAPSGAPESEGVITAVSPAAYAGIKVRNISATGAGYFAIFTSPYIPCGPGEQFHASAYAYSASGGRGTCVAGMLFYDSAGAVLGGGVADVSSTAASWTQIRSHGTAPAGTVSVRYYLQLYGASLSAGDYAYFDNLYFRRMADSYLIVDGGVQANNILAGAVQTYHMSVGPLIEFKARSSGGAVLKGYADGSCGRDPAPPTGYAENATDARWYADPTRLYPSSGCDSNTYEINVGIGTANRGILINLADPFPAGSAGGLLIWHTATSLVVYAVSAIGGFTSKKTASVATAGANDRLTVIYYNTSETSATVRMQVYLNGQIVTWSDGKTYVSDADLGPGYNGAKSGYAGIMLQDTTVRVWGVKYGKGSVVIQDGVITADKFVADLAIVNTVRSFNYSAGTHSAACTGFKMANTAFDVALKTPPGGTDTHANAQLEIGSDAVIGGYKAAVLTNNSIGGYQEWILAGTYTASLPEGVQTIRIICSGAGGGGGAGNHSVNVQAGGGGGGGGGSIAMDWDVPAGVTELDIVVGAGGSGGAGSDGGDGGFSSVYNDSDLIVKALGGKGGLRPTSIATGDGGDGGGVQGSSNVLGGFSLSIAAGGNGGAGKLITGGVVSGDPGTEDYIEHDFLVGWIAPGSGGGGGCPEGTGISVNGGEGGDILSRTSVVSTRWGAPAVSLHASTSGSAGGGGGRGMYGGVYPAGEGGGIMKGTLNGAAGTYGAGGGGGSSIYGASQSGSGGAGGAGYVRIEW